MLGESISCETPLTVIVILLMLIGGSVGNRTRVRKVSSQEVYVRVQFKSGNLKSDLHRHDLLCGCAQATRESMYWRLHYPTVF